MSWKQHYLHGGLYEIYIGTPYCGEVSVSLSGGGRQIKSLSVREPGWLAKRRGMTLEKAVDRAVDQLIAITDELEAERKRMESAALAASDRLAARLEERRPKSAGRERKPCLKSTGR